jgi:alpha-N-arabinofuranosidase
VPEDQLQPYIDEVIKEIDFLTASGDNNDMGALRKRLGRDKPFDLKYVEIGNEDNFASGSYSYRWPAFFNALHQKYPNITFIATTTGSIQSPPAVDDHNYDVPSFFIKNFRRYESIPRPTPKVLAGEFSVLRDDDSQIPNPFGGKRLDFPSIKSAVAESIYRIGFERNSDVIIGGCYAPVLQNVDQTQWTPNLILFNAGLVVRSTSHLAQQIFGVNLGNFILNSTAANSIITHQSVRKGEEGDGKLGNLYFIATKRTNDNTLIVKLASVDPNDTVVKVKIQGSRTSSEGAAYILTAGPGVDPTTVKNTFMNPNAASITTKPVTATDGTFSITIPSWSVVVVTLAL